MPLQYSLIGLLKSGEAIYKNSVNRVFIEKDHSYLVDPTNKERSEIHQIFPELMPLMPPVDPSACTWSEGENGPWSTSCGQDFELIEGSPSENKMHFCCYCGVVLIEKLFEHDPGENTPLDLKEK